MKKHINNGALAIIVAAILWSLDGYLRRQLFHLPVSVIIFWEHLIGLALILPIMLRGYKDLVLPTKKQLWAILLVAFLSGALGTILFTAALFQVNFIPFSVVVLLQQFQPLFAITAAYFLLGERLQRKFALLIPLALVAGWLLTFPDPLNAASYQGTLMAGLMALGSAAAWGTSTAFSKYSLKGVKPITTTTLRFAFAPFFVLPFMLQNQAYEQVFTLGASDIVTLLMIALSTGMVALFIYYYGLKRVPASQSTILELAWPISASLVGFFVFKDQLTPLQWLAALTLVAIVTTVSRARKGELVETISK